MSENLKNITYIILIFFFVPYSVAQVSLLPYTTPTTVNPALLQQYNFVIPPWILQQYQQVASAWRNPLNYLLYFYSRYGASFEDDDDDDLDSIYIPLFESDDLNPEYESKTYWKDLSSLNISKDPSTGSYIFRSQRKGSDNPSMEKGKVISTVQDPFQIQNSEGKTAPQTCKEQREQEGTEAKSICIECIKRQGDNVDLLAEIVENHLGGQEDKGKAIESFLTKVDQEVKKYDRYKFFTHLVNTFCKKCYQADLNEFVNYVERRSREANIPSEIFFSIMLRESGGNCDLKSPGAENSYGLFQMNIESKSTFLRTCNEGELQNLGNENLKTPCENGNYPNNSDKQIKNKACLNNPYCNFEESLRLLQEKWNLANKGSGGRKLTRPKKSWTEMNAKERNLWRNAVISYNGRGYLAPAEKEMKKRGLLNLPLNNWELKRLFFLGSGSKKKGRIWNLAYVERITGREVGPCGLENSSIYQWLEFKGKKENQPLSCQ